MVITEEQLIAAMRVMHKAKGSSAIFERISKTQKTRMKREICEVLIALGVTDFVLSPDAVDA